MLGAQTSCLQLFFRLALGAQTSCLPTFFRAPRSLQAGCLRSQPKREFVLLLVSRRDRPACVVLWGCRRRALWCQSAARRAATDLAAGAARGSAQTKRSRA